MSEKKRSRYARGSKLDLPKHVDKNKYEYRWVSQRNAEARSDGYDPRGWELDKNTDGNLTKVEDLILARMPKDEFEDMKAEKQEARDSLLANFFESQAAQEEELNHEFKKKGGKVKFEFKQE